MATGEKCEGMEVRIARLGCAEVVEKEQNRCAAREVPVRVFVMAMVGLMVAAGAKGQQAKATAVVPPIQVPAGIGFQNVPASAGVVAVGSVCSAGALRAQAQSAGETVWTIALEDSKYPASVKRQGSSGVHFDLKSSFGALREIELSVSYIAPGARVMPLGAPDAKDVRKKTFKLSADGQKDVDGDLLIGQAFQITSVHMMSATYADGSTWRARGENDCNVEPSRFLRVAAK